MTEHSFDYMADCPTYQFSNADCCNAKKDCGVIISHNNERNSHPPVHPTTIEFTVLASALSGVVYFILERVFA